VVRPYVLVNDIEAAVKAAEAAGGQVAVPIESGSRMRSSAYDSQTTASERSGRSPGGRIGSMATTFELHPIGRVGSPIRTREQAPKQGDEGAPEAWLELDPAVAEAARHLRVGEEVILLTWLDRADRSVLSVRPRGDERRPLTGVFSTRSPDRPNPIGLHRVTVLEIAGGLRLRVSGLEALDGTPILDLKPVLGRVRER